MHEKNPHFDMSIYHAKQYEQQFDTGRKAAGILNY